MNKKVSIIIVGIMAVGLLVGCSDKKPTEDETAVVVVTDDKETNTDAPEAEGTDNATGEEVLEAEDGIVQEDSLVGDGEEGIEKSQEVVPVGETPEIENVNTIGPQYNSTKGSPEYREEDDLNSDGIIDIYDIVLKAKKEEK